MGNHEDPQVGRLRCELPLDPAVAAAADLAVVEVGLGRVDRHDGDAALAQHGVALSEQLLEMDIADIARIVVAGHDDEVLALDAIEVLAREHVFVLEPERCQVTRADDDVRFQLVDLPDRPFQQVRLEILPPAMQVREVSDAEDRTRGDGHEASLRCFRPAGEGRPSA